MISPIAVQRWMDRPLRDSARAKRLPRKRILRMYRESHPPKLSNKLRHHQRVGFLLCLQRRRYLLFYDPGLGKSLISLALYSHYRRRRNPKIKMLVTVPNASNVGQWCDEIRKQTGLKPVGVDGNGSTKRWQQLMDPSADVVIITYMGLLSLVCNKKAKKRKTARGWKIDYKLVDKVAAQFGFLTFDESTAFGSANSMTYRMCKSLSWSETTRAAYALTGTPMGNDPTPLWAQFHVIDGGETLGETMALYRGAFFRGKRNYWGGMEWKFDRRKKWLLNRMIRNRSIRYEENECLDLPKIVPITRLVEFPRETWKYYDRLVEQLREQQIAQAVKVSDNPFHRMRSITAGYLVLKTEAGDKSIIRFKENPKLDALLADIHDISPKRKIVVFHHYNQTGQIISDALTKAKIKHIRLWSGTPAKLKRDIAHAFNDPSVRVLVSSSAGAFGGNWQVGNYVMFFEPPSDPKMRKQMLKRCHRMGQKRSVFVMDYAVRGSIDTRLLKMQKQGKDLMDAIVDGTVPVNFLARRH